MPDAAADRSGPFLELSRRAWSQLASSAQVPLERPTIERLRGLGDPTNVADVTDVYLPLTRLISRYIQFKGQLARASNAFLDLDVEQTPFIIGVAGSVAVGKSTTARLLRELLARNPAHPRVDLITTDGFLLPNAELERRGLMQRKGFPESYDRRALMRFVVDVKSGKPAVSAPVYSHLVYDIVPGERVTVNRPDILVIEGLNVLQPAALQGSRGGLAISDFFDFSVYVDAAHSDIRNWYVERFLSLRKTAFRDPDSFFRSYAELSQPDAIARAESVWDAINGPNLDQNIRPTRNRATAILRKGENHEVKWVRIRKI